MRDLEVCMYRRESIKSVFWAEGGTKVHQLTGSSVVSRKSLPTEDSFWHCGMDVFYFWPTYFSSCESRESKFHPFLMSYVETHIYTYIIYGNNPFGFLLLGGHGLPLTPDPLFFLGESLLFILKLSRSIILYFLSSNPLPIKILFLKHPNHKVKQQETMSLQPGRRVCACAFAHGEGGEVKRGWT